MIRLSSLKNKQPIKSCLYFKRLLWEAAIWLFSTRIIFFVGIFTLVGIASSASAFAANDSWKPNPLRIVISQGVGGGHDKVTRIFGKHWQKYLKSKIVFENKKGGSQHIGFEYFLKQDDAMNGSVILSSQVAKWNLTAYL